MTWLRRLARNPLLDVGAVFIALLRVVGIAIVVPSRMVDWDFNHFYVSSWMLLHGLNPYTTPMAPFSQQMGFVTKDLIPIAGYPPPFLWLFAPLAALPPRMAFALWVAGEVACLVFILWITGRLLGNRLSGRGRLFVCAATVASATVFWQFYNSQLQLLLIALILGAYAWHRQGRQNLACLAVTIAGLLKIYPFILLPWFIWRSADNAPARVRCAFLTTVVGTAAVLTTGPGLWRDFVLFGIPMAVGQEVGVNFHYSLSSFVTNLGLAMTRPHRSPGELHLCWAVGTIAGLLVIGLSYLASARASRSEETGFSLLLVAMLAGTVTVQGHYFVWLIFPLALAAVQVARQPSVRRVLGFAIIALLANDVSPPDSRLHANNIYLWLLVNYKPLYGLAGLGLFLWGEMRKLQFSQRFAQ